jgi:hypothetical protein
VLLFAHIARTLGRQDEEASHRVGRRSDRRERCVEVWIRRRIRLTAHDEPMRKSDVRAAAEIIRALLARIASGELAASKRVIARLDGAATAFEALARRRQR